MKAYVAASGGRRQAVEAMVLLEAEILGGHIQDVSTTPSPASMERGNGRVLSQHEFLWQA